MNPSRVIRVPFHVATDGGISYTTDGVEQAAQQLMSVAATNPGERVMRPDYGVPLAAMLFEPDDVLVQTEIQARLQNGFRQWVPGVTVTAITPESSRPDDATVSFRISFQLPGSAETYTAVIQMGGTVQDFVVSQ